MHFVLKKLNHFFVVLFSICCSGQIIANTDLDKKLLSALFVDSEEPNKVISQLEMHLTEGANINSKGPLGTPVLLQAVNQGHQEAVLSFLIEKGADINGMGDNGSTIAHMIPGEIAKLKFFESKGANFKMQFNTRNKSGVTPFHIIASPHYYVPGIKDNLVRFFLNHGADPNIQDKDGNTPLHLLALNISKNNSINVLLDALSMLVSSKGINLNKKNNKGKTFFDLLTGDKFRTFCEKIFHAVSIKGVGSCRYSQSGNKDKVICVDGEYQLKESSFDSMSNFFSKILSFSSVSSSRIILKNKCGYENRVYCEVVMETNPIYCHDELSSNPKPYIKSASVFSGNRSDDLKKTDQEDANTQKAGILD